MRQIKQMDEMLLRDVTGYSSRGILTVRITRIWEHWGPDGNDLFGIKLHHDRFSGRNNGRHNSKYRSSRTGSLKEQFTSLALTRFNMLGKDTKLYIVHGE